MSVFHVLFLFCGFRMLNYISFLKLNYNPFWSGTIQFILSDRIFTAVIYYFEGNSCAKIVPVETTNSKIPVFHIVKIWRSFCFGTW